MALRYYTVVTTWKKGGHPDASTSCSLEPTGFPEILIAQEWMNNSILSPEKLHIVLTGIPNY
jgi:hypothetical protein